MEKITIHSIDDYIDIICQEEQFIFGPIAAPVILIIGVEIMYGAPRVKLSNRRFSARWIYKMGFKGKAI
jgi:hypothetical protein